MRLAQKIVQHMSTEYEKWKTQARKGLLEYFVYKVLNEKESYGYEILQSLEKHSSMKITESAVYPILAKAAKADLMSAKLVESAEGPSRRYFSLTPKGRVWLAKMNVFIKELESDFSDA